MFAVYHDGSDIAKKHLSCTGFSLVGFHGSRTCMASLSRAGCVGWSPVPATSQPRAHHFGDPPGIARIQSISRNSASSLGVGTSSLQELNHHTWPSAERGGCALQCRRVQPIWLLSWLDLLHDPAKGKHLSCEHHAFQGQH